MISFDGMLFCVSFFFWSFVFGGSSQLGYVVNNHG